MAKTRAYEPSERWDPDDAEWVACVQAPIPHGEYMNGLPPLVVGPYRGTREAARAHFVEVGYPDAWMQLYPPHSVGMQPHVQWPWQWRTDLLGDLLVRTSLKLQHAYEHLGCLRRLPPPTFGEVHHPDQFEIDLVAEEAKAGGRYHTLHMRLMDIAYYARMAAVVANATMYRPWRWRGEGE